MTGILVKAIAGFYYVEDNGVRYECKARGSFRNNGVTPLVGDRVVYSLSDATHGVLEEILPRHNAMDRPALANLDRLFILSSFTTPAPNALLIDQMTAVALFHGIEPILVFNKCDLGSFEEWSRLYRHAGFTVLVVSAATGEGVEAFKTYLSGCVSAFTGNSGVGKSSLLNLLFPNLSLATGEVSEKLGRGRHTTRHTELFSHPFGGYIADTPGFSTLDSVSLGLPFKERLLSCFPDLEAHADTCRFTSCTHTGEKGCAVEQAVRDGMVEPSRWQSYRNLYHELKDLRPWNTK